MISFTLPIALTVIRREDTSLFMQGSVWGIVTIPAGVAVGALLTGLPVKELVRNLLPILLLCAGICLALIKAAEATIRVLSVVGNLVRIASLVLFGLVMLGLFLPACQIASDTLIFESLTIVVKIAVVVAGPWWRPLCPPVFPEGDQPDRRMAGGQFLFCGGTDHQPGHLYFHDPNDGKNG